jgi:hypothetical protein
VIAADKWRHGTQQSEWGAAWSLKFGSKVGYVSATGPGWFEQWTPGSLFHGTLVAEVATDGKGTGEVPKYQLTLDVGKPSGYMIMADRLYAAVDDVEGITLTAWIGDGEGSGAKEKSDWSDVQDLTFDPTPAANTDTVKVTASEPKVYEIIGTSTEHSTLTDNATLTFLKVESVTHSNPHCWDRGEITFTAVPSPSGAVFPSGSPTWTATVGSFPGGNTGPSVVWKAPTGSGGTATITATYGSSSADDVVTYVHVSMPTTGGDLLREATDSFSASVDPAGYSVSLTGVSTPPELRLSISGLAIAYENLIQATDIEAHADHVAAHIEAALSGCSGKIFGFEYDLQKRFSDYYDNVTVFEGRYAYDRLVDAVSDAVGDQTKVAALAQGFNSVVSDELGSLVKSKTKAQLHLADPFPGTVTDSVIKESTTFTWSRSSSVEMGAGTITIKASGYPGWPEINPPSISDWITGINENGFSSKLCEITGASAALSVSANSANWNVSVGLVLSCEDPWGSWVLTGGLVLWMGW